MKRIILILGILFALRVDAGMVRVVDVQDGRTLIIERNSSRETVRLAGVAIVDELRAAELLRWIVVSSWVLLEPHASGGHLAFRSPDALFVNRELVLRGYARATAHGIEPERNLRVTFLGVIDPPATGITATRPRTGTDTSRRRTTTRPPRTRGAGASSSGRARSSSSKPR